MVLFLSLAPAVMYIFAYQLVVVAFRVSSIFPTFVFRDFFAGVVALLLETTLTLEFTVHTHTMFKQIFEVLNKRHTIYSLGWR